MSRLPSGIYKITNTLNGKIYVGQSQNVFLRKKQHFTELRHNAHPNKGMQRDWNKNNHGFRFDVIEYCSISELNEREHYWIDKLDTIANGYNEGWVPYKRKPAKKKAYRQKHYHKTS